ncbi:MAG: hypothetical protein Q8M76_01545, partial [Spirochaetaceae bacterium]|nr:hypothetical protein [Spirochaetaceae bacterium]
CAGHDPDEGDADLDGGKEPGWLLRERERGLGFGGAVGRERFEASFPRRDDRNLGHREYTIGEQKDEDDEDFGKVVHEDEM